MNFDDLQAIQNDVQRLNLRNRELEAEIQKLHIELMNMDDSRKIAESERARLQQWNDDCVTEGGRLFGENAALKTLVTNIVSASMLPETYAELRRFPLWVRTAIDKVMVKP